jgi:hypothetical protein
MDFDAAPARAHVTGGEFDDVGNRRRQINVRLFAHFFHTPDDPRLRNCGAAIGGHPTHERRRRLGVRLIPRLRAAYRIQIE